MSSTLITALILVASFACLYGVSEWAARRMQSKTKDRTGSNPG